MGTVELGSSADLHFRECFGDTRWDTRGWALHGRSLGSARWGSENWEARAQARSSGGIGQEKAALGDPGKAKRREYFADLCEMLTSGMLLILRKDAGSLKAQQKQTSQIQHPSRVALAAGSEPLSL